MVQDGLGLDAGALAVGDVAPDHHHAGLALPFQRRGGHEQVAPLAAHEDGGAEIAHQAGLGHRGGEAPRLIDVGPQAQLMGRAVHHLVAAEAGQRAEAVVGEADAAVADAGDTDRVGAGAQQPVQHVGSALVLLQREALAGDVVADAAPAGVAAGRVEHRLARGQGPQQAAIGHPKAVDAVTVGAPGPDVFDQGVEFRVPNELGAAGLAQAHDVFAAVAGERLEFVGQHGDAEVRIRLPGPVVCGTHQAGQALLLAQRGAQRVADDALDQQRREQRRGGDQAMHDHAIRQAHLPHGRRAADEAAHFQRGQHADDDEVESGQQPGRAAAGQRTAEHDAETPGQQGHRVHAKARGRRVQRECQHRDDQCADGGGAWPAGAAQPLRDPTGGEQAECDQQALGGQRIGVIGRKLQPGQHSERAADAQQHGHQHPRRELLWRLAPARLGCVCSAGRASRRRIHCERGCRRRTAWSGCRRSDTAAPARRGRPCGRCR
mmetsp:Transcript_118970/g.330501  ORF Transcript_118970/g.330501 Transcript_118970/m.330501 type:complete len:491 (-) Transcript_118970:526-1998(-)